jgi:microtubule-associated protein-like 6
LSLFLSKKTYKKTAGGEIYEMVTKDAKLTTSTKFANPRRLISSHFAPNKKSTNELWGLTPFANDNDLIASCSDDGTLRVWSVQHKRLLRSTSINIDEKG